MDVVSLFCGCGGLDYGFEDAGFNIVWANDFDKYAVESYNKNFKIQAICADINEVDYDTIPIHDVIIGGFPCQPFSMMGKEEGFHDKKRGNLFFKTIEIIENQIKRGNVPKAIVLENVRNLMNHDKGKTFLTIKDELERLGYNVFSKVLNSADYGVPQTRKRAFIVCFSNHSLNFEFPKEQELKCSLQDILEIYTDKKYFLSEKILKTILSTGTKNYKAKPEIDLSIARPLTATMAKMHRASQDNYVTQHGNIRRLTPRECARLQGFPDTYTITVSDYQAYKQFGNAVTVNVACAIAKNIIQQLEMEI